MDFSLRYCRSVHWIKCQFYCCNNRLMLISPLMGPIVAGFGLGVYDFNLLKDPKNLLIATLVVIGFYHLFLC
jgi:hypothetical protein